ncbi:MAG: pyridoxamine 5'-phosphate oxidase family protein [Candidatus Heimdallarchaeota archaeon]|nr:pyridoxamine 5'-phosphate oxidase family protein [Candidatus Heimdallarchaeota archaeon]MCK4253671.1 pyridoxamine 5'-phosphate oxidase family protein [Candidatus Heimdallarchaeota archaeon]
MYNEVARYYGKPNDVKGIMLKGEAEILDDMDFNKQIWDDKWKIYCPEGVTDPDFTILRITPKYLKGWYRGHLEIKFQYNVHQSANTNQT